MVTVCTLEHVRLSLSGAHPMWRVAAFREVCDGFGLSLLMRAKTEARQTPDRCDPNPSRMWGASLCDPRFSEVTP